MKSTNKQLKSRGYFSKEVENKFALSSFDEILELLSSKLAEERTVAAFLLSKIKNPESISALCSALQIETKLYSKVEISKALASYSLLSLACLINILGEIGNNQHKSIPKKEFKKNSYPLPRDIAARTIIRIGKDALPFLIQVLKSKDLRKLSEAIDAIGFICFHDGQDYILQDLTECYNNNSQNELIKWKLIRAMSAFPRSEKFLIKKNEQVANLRVRQEIKRSIYLINK